MRIQALFAFAALALGLGLVAAGCGGSPGTASVEGTIDKKSVTPKEAVSFELDQQGFGAGVILISTETGTCDLFKKTELHKNMQMLEIALAQIDIAAQKSVPPTETGEIPVFDPNGGGSAPLSLVAAIVTYFRVDDNCLLQGDLVFGKSGTITLDSIDDGAYAGSGDVELSTGDHITFEFDTISCGKIENITTPSGQATCK